MRYLNRHIQYHIQKLLKAFKVVVVTGARQTGKTTLLKHVFPGMNYISLDDPFVEQQANEHPEMFMMNCPANSIIDEVQYAPNLFRYIKIQCDNSSENGLYLLSGSQPFKLMEVASDSLAGRVAIVEISTFSYREITDRNFFEPFLPSLDYLKNNQSTIKKPRNIWKLIHKGGYPALQDKDLSWGDFYSSYTKTYLERDVRDLQSVQNLNTFRKFLVACAARTGQIVNYSNMASEVEIDSATVKNWISILESSGIVYLLEPFSNSVLKRAIKSPKLYFRDTGLAAYLTRWTSAEVLSMGAMSGAFFETYVISEILKSFSNVGLDYRYFVSYYRGRDKIRKRKNGHTLTKESEIDLIIEKDGQLFPIEVKQSSNVRADATESFMVLDRLEDKERGMGAVVCACAIPGILRENILQIPVWYI